MKNVEYTINKNKLVITVDLGKSFGPSSTGKTIIVATSGGTTPLEGGCKLGLNVFKSKPADQE